MIFDSAFIDCTKNRVPGRFYSIYPSLEFLLNTVYHKDIATV